MTKQRIFGELGKLKKNKKTLSKLKNKGVSCMFLGYSENHPANTYRGVVIARDVQWLNTT